MGPHLNYFFPVVSGEPAIDNVTFAFQRFRIRLEGVTSILGMSYSHILTAILAAVVIYLCYLVIYGYFLCPTRHIPGPFLTRFTRAQYYFLLFGGSVSIKVHKLHQKYGSNDHEKR
jgi:ABC-type multidrug transport system permease subunit